MLQLHQPARVKHPLFRTYSVGQFRARFGIGFGPEAQRQLSLLNHYVQLTPSLEQYANVAFESLCQTDVMQSERLGRSRLGGRLLPSLGRFLFDAVDRVALLQGRARRFKLRAFLDQYPVPTNRVKLSGKSSARGIPTSDLIWRYSARDRASVVQFLQALDNELRRYDIGQVDLEPLRLAGDEWPLTAVHSHYMGTTRMAACASEGVVDSDCRVFGQANLFVSGPSVFPTYGFANPFLTITALGLRLAEHIHRRQFVAA